MTLFNNLEFTGINDLPVSVPKLVDVNAPIKISKWDIDFWSNGFQVKNLLAYKIKNLERKEFIKAFLKFEIDKTGGRIGIKPHKFCRSVRRSCYYCFLG